MYLGRNAESDMAEILAKKKRQLEQLRLEKEKIHQRLTLKQVNGRLAYEDAFICKRSHAENWFLYILIWQKVIGYWDTCRGEIITVNIFFSFRHTEADRMCLGWNLEAPSLLVQCQQLQLYQE